MVGGTLLGQGRPQRRDGDGLLVERQRLLRRALAEQLVALGLEAVRFALAAAGSVVLLLRDVGRCLVGGTRSTASCFAAIGCRVSLSTGVRAPFLRRDRLRHRPPSH